MYGYYYPTMPQYPMMPQQPAEFNNDLYTYSRNNHQQDHNPNMEVGPIIQPEYVNHKPADYTKVQSVAKIPQPTRYVTDVNPVYLEHLSQHRGMKITVQTTVNEVKGVLEGVAIDHIALDTGNHKTLHIQLDQIVYFESTSPS